MIEVNLLAMILAVLGAFVVGFFAGIIHRPASSRRHDGRTIDLTGHRIGSGTRPHSDPGPKPVRLEGHGYQPSRPAGMDPPTQPPERKP